MLLRHSIWKRFIGQGVMSKRTKRQRTRASSKAAGGWRRHLATERTVIGGTVIAALVIFGVIALSSAANQPIEVEGVEYVVIAGGSHQDGPIDHDEGLPAAGGAHNDTWLNCGIYDQPVSDEFAVHSLEHSAVWIAYHPNLPVDQVETLRNVTRQGSYRILSPYPNLVSPIVATAWGVRLRLENADDERLLQFIRNFELSANAPEPGALCSRGVGQPIS
jgi:hypothetical protein